MAPTADDGWDARDDAECPSLSGEPDAQGYESVWDGRADGPARGLLRIQPHPTRPAPPIKKRKQAHPGVRSGARR